MCVRVLPGAEGGRTVEAVLREALGQAPAANIVAAMVSDFSTQVNAAMSSALPGGPLLRLYQSVERRPHTNTLAAWANGDHLWFNGPPRFGDGNFSVCLFDSGHCMVPLLAKTLDHAEAEAIKEFVACFAVEAEVNELFPVIHGSLVPFSLLARPHSTELRQLMPFYPITLDHFSGRWSSHSAKAIFADLESCLAFLHDHQLILSR